MAAVDPVLAAGQFAARRRCRPAVRRAAGDQRSRPGAAVLPAVHVRHPLSRRQRTPIATTASRRAGTGRSAGRPRRWSAFLGSVRLGRAALFRHLPGTRRRRCRSTSSPSNGCGRCSIRAASARSTSCTFRSGQPVRLIMASQDVIHSFFMPAFRIKHDVVPGRYQNLWFEASATGVYHLFCAEYLRHRSFAHDRPDRRDRRRRSSSPGWRGQDVTGTLAAEGAGLFRSAWLQRLPRRRQRRARAAARRPLWPAGAAAERRRRDRRRQVSARFHPAAARADRRRLRAGDAVLRRQGRPRTISSGWSPTSSRWPTPRARRRHDRSATISPPTTGCAPGSSPPTTSASRCSISPASRCSSSSAARPPR